MNIEELNLTDEQVALVTKYVQSETDKVRTDYSNKLKTVNEELSKYKPQEKSEAELNFEKRLSALEEREKQIANKERAMSISSKLKEKGIPSELAKFLNVGENIDETIEEVGKVFGNYFLNGSNVPTRHKTNKGITKEEFKKMSYTERSKLYQEDPSLYKALSK